MEAVAAVASIVQLVQFSGQILVHGYGFLARVSAAPNEIRILLTEVANVNVILDRVRGLASDPNFGHLQITTDKLIQLGALDNCRVQLNRTQECLEKCKQVDGQGLANIGRKLNWAFIEKDVKSTIDQLRGLQAQINQAVNLDSAHTVLRIEDNTKQIFHKVDGISMSTQAMLEQRERDRILRKISPDRVDLDEAYHSALRIRKGSTGQWLTSAPGFQSFINAEGSSLFWLSGRPGSGKTILCTTVIETILNNFLSPIDGLAFFYCGHQNSNADTLSQFLLHTTMHLLRCRPQCITQLSDKMPKQDRRLIQSDYLTLLKIMLPCFQKVFVIVDALDESDHFEAMVQVFAELLSSSTAKGRVHILLTSREEIDIEKALGPLSPIRMSTSENIWEDIHSFIISEVDDRIVQRKLKLRDAGLVTKIKKSLFRAADGIFLQAKMQLDYVSSLRSDRAIRNALEGLPSGLDEVYDQVLAQIARKPGYDPEVVRTIFIWVSSTYNLLTINEIAEAVSMRSEDKTFDHENVATDPEDLVGLCGSLLRLERVATGDSVPLVGLVHYSAEEYLFSEHIAKGQLSYFRIDNHQAHLYLARQCLQYLAFKNFSGEGLMGDAWFIPDSDILRLTNRYALLKYASLKWADHLRDSAISEEVYQAQILPHLSWFLNPGVEGNNYQVWQSIFHANCKDDDNCAYQTPFFNAIVLGLQHVVRTLLSDYLPHINTPFHNGWTPLTAAIMTRQEAVAYFLLCAGADPNICSDEERHNGLSALHIAAENSMDEAVEMLLHFGASVDARTRTGTTPFYRAARGGSLRTLTLLHDHGSDINARTWDDWTAIIEAVWDGHDAVIERLLEWGADTTVITFEGCTAYTYASDKPNIQLMLMHHQQGRQPGQRNDEIPLPYRSSVISPDWTK